ncbi:MAG: hypothetical protein IJ661_10240 [Lachnospiraceae bacterium]|nr:hypothetical protein [Lachnospiraceae bacterium]
MDREFIIDFREFFTLWIFPILCIAFTVWSTHLWIGEYVEFKMHADKYIIQEAQIERVYHGGRASRNIEYSYYFDNARKIGRHSAYLGDVKGKTIKIAVDSNGKSIRPDFPWNIVDIFIEFFLLFCSFFCLYFLTIFVIKDIKMYWK